MIIIIKYKYFRVIHEYIIILLKMYFTFMHKPFEKKVNKSFIVVYMYVMYLT